MHPRQTDPPVDTAHPTDTDHSVREWCLALVTWVAGAAALTVLDGRLDIVNLAMIVILTAVITSIWTPPVLSALAGTAAVAAFNWFFVPPRGAFAVERVQDLVLLGSMLVLIWIVTNLVHRQRRQALSAAQAAQREAQIGAWGERLRSVDDPLSLMPELTEQVSALTRGRVVALVLGRIGASPESPETRWFGDPDDDQRVGLDLCVRRALALGVGTTESADLPDTFWPLRARQQALGALAAVGGVPEANAERVHRHIQTLCDQMGTAWHRVLLALDQQAARELAQQQATRNALLAAIAHDYRTPLSTILGAASALQIQARDLSADRVCRYATSIVEEAQRLKRLTDNTLQLARLGSARLELQCDWESVEEILASVQHHVRKRPDGHRFHQRVEPNVPLVWCDATLVIQLLDNLIDNALRYSPAHAPVELLVRVLAAHVVMAVRDRGPGVHPAWRERVFEVFQRGQAPVFEAAPTAANAAPGAGVGLALCRAIASAHGGELRLRPRGHGGASFEFHLPVREAPMPPPDAKVRAHPERVGVDGRNHPAR